MLIANTRGTLYSVLRDFFGIPTADSTLNNYTPQVIGNKSDIANDAAGEASVIALLRKLLTTSTSAAESGGLEINDSISTDLNVAADTYDIYVVTEQPILLFGLIARCPDSAAGGALTAIAIHSSHVRNAIYVSAADAVVANLTAENQFTWSGIGYLDSGDRVQLTSQGGAAGSEYLLSTTLLYCPVADAGFAYDSKSIDLNVVVDTYDLFTAMTESVILIGLVINSPDAGAVGALTSVAITMNSTTSQELISAVDGAAAHLLLENQIIWKGVMRMNIGDKIQITTTGGATGFKYKLNVGVLYYADTDGGRVALG